MIILAGMPIWAQKLTLVQLVAHFIEVMPRVMLKGTGIDEIWPFAAFLAVYALLTRGRATHSYSNVSA